MNGKEPSKTKENMQKCTRGIAHLKLGLRVVVSCACLQDLSSKIGVSIKPIFTSKKIGEIIKTREPKPKIINEQCVVYHFKCGLCEMDYVGFTNRHLFQRINEHTNSTVILIFLVKCFSKQLLMRK